MVTCAVNYSPLRVAAHQRLLSHLEACQAVQDKLHSVLLAAPGVKHPDLLGRQDEEYWEEVEDEEAREGDELWEDAAAGDDEAALETGELAEEMDRERASKPAGGKARAVKPAAARPDLAEAVAEEAEERAEEAAEVAAEEAEEAAVEAELQARRTPTTPGFAVPHLSLPACYEKAADEAAEEAGSACGGHGTERVATNALNLTRLSCSLPCMTD